VLTEARAAFRLYPVLEPLEGFLDAPALIWYRSANQYAGAACSSELVASIRTALFGAI
jgi:hypothetical protein